ncbi:MAG: bacteriohemerythrin [Bellilinea sp.]
MALIKWEDRYSVKISKFDHQHQQLVSMINQLYDAMKVGKGQVELGKILEELVDYTRKHFSSEEALMLKHAYPQYAEHKASHDRLTHQVIDFKNQYHEGKIGLSIQMMNFLKEWLVNHILDEDKAYSNFFEAKGEK